MGVLFPLAVGVPEFCITAARFGFCCTVVPGPDVAVVAEIPEHVKFNSVINK